MTKKRKTIKVVKAQILWKGDRIDYEDLILSVIGREVSRLSCIRTVNEGTDKGRDYFVPDCDYEIIIRPMKGIKRIQI